MVPNMQAAVPSIAVGSGSTPAHAFRRAARAAAVARVALAGLVLFAAAAPASAADAWGGTKRMTSARAYFTLTTLADGRALATGGRDGPQTTTATAEVYDPGSRSWAATGSLASARSEHTATLLADGRVLVTGGFDSAHPGRYATVELYDPASGS